MYVVKTIAQVELDEPMFNRVYIDSQVYEGLYQTFYLYDANEEQILTGIIHVEQKLSIVEFGQKTGYTVGNNVITSDE